MDSIRFGYLKAGKVLPIDWFKWLWNGSWIGIGLLIVCSTPSGQSIWKGFCLEEAVRANRVEAKLNVSDKRQIALSNNTKSNLFAWQLSCWRDQYQLPACVSVCHCFSVPIENRKLKTALGLHFTLCQLQLAKKHLAMPSKSNKLMQIRATELVVPVQFKCV